MIAEAMTLNDDKKVGRNLVNLYHKILLNIKEMWWLIGSAPDFWGSGPGFESGISHSGKNSEDRQSPCVYCKISG